VERAEDFLQLAAVGLPTEFKISSRRMTGREALTLSVVHDYSVQRYDVVREDELFNHIQLQAACRQRTSELHERPLACSTILKVAGGDHR
jgi:hypothetical protein